MKGMELRTVHCGVMESKTIKGCNATGQRVKYILGWGSKGLDDLGWTRNVMGLYQGFFKMWP